MGQSYNIEKPYLWNLNVKMIKKERMASKFWNGTIHRNFHFYSSIVSERANQAIWPANVLLNNSHCELRGISYIFASEST